MNMLIREICSPRTFFFTFVLCVAARNTNVYTTVSSTSDATCTDAVFRFVLFVNFISGAGRGGGRRGAEFASFIFLSLVGTAQSVPKSEQYRTLPGTKRIHRGKKKHK
ncbi:UNVERIFIED_CONTAM: hypothetical protein K2H54_066739 [Gekko kuhli]